MKRLEAAERHFGVDEVHPEHHLDTSELNDDELWFLDRISDDCAARGDQTVLADLSDDELVALDAILAKCGDGDDNLAGPDDPVPDEAVDYCGHYQALKNNQKRREAREARDAAIGRAITAFRTRNK
jgi:hypothetical protein